MSKRFIIPQIIIVIALLATVAQRAFAQAVGTCDQFHSSIQTSDACLNNGAASGWFQLFGDVKEDFRNTPFCSPTNSTKCGHLQVVGINNIALNGTPGNGQTYCFVSANNDFEPCNGGGSAPGGPNTAVQYNNNGVFGGSSSFTTTGNGTTVNSGHFTINNVNAAVGDSDLEITVDPNGDSAISMDTGDTGPGKNGNWFIQGTNAAHFSQLEFVSKLYEPLTLWGDTGSTAWDGTMDYQQPFNGAAPFHLIRASDTPAANASIIDIESLGGGLTPTVYWFMDAKGFEHFNGSSSGSIQISPAAAAGTGTLWVWPPNNGTTNYVLTDTDGAGTTGWQAVTAVLPTIPWRPGFDFQGSVATCVANNTTCAVAYTCPVTVTIPANTAGTVVTCGTNPGESDAYLLKVAGATKATLTIDTSCVLTLSSQAGFTCTAGQRFEIDAPATVSGNDVSFTVVGTQPSS